MTPQQFKQIVDAALKFAEAESLLYDDPNTRQRMQLCRKVVYRLNDVDIEEALTQLFREAVNQFDN